MKTSRFRWNPTTAGLALAALLGAALTQAADSTPCCFTNSRYSGVCAVEPSGDETCASILAYLNNPNSQGKTYCGNTNVRGGWRKARCERQEGAAHRVN
jgi:hypothetical protein